MNLAEDVYATLRGINMETSRLRLCAMDHSAAGDDVAAAYCQELSRKLWQLTDEIDADARANGILPGSGA